MTSLGKRLKLYHSPGNPIGIPNPEIPNQSLYSWHDLFAVIEKHKWELVDDITDADVVPAIWNSMEDWFYNGVKQHVRNDQLILALHFFHSDNFLTKSWYRTHCHKFILTHPKTLFIHSNNYDNGLDDHFLFYDIMFNREKYYFHDLEDDFKIDSKVWTRNSNRIMYTYSDIDKVVSPASKKILCLNRLYWEVTSNAPQKIIRTSLHDLFRDRTDVYLSDPREGVFLYPNGDDACSNISIRNSAGTWYPAADRYYNSSYVNVYVESVVQGNARTIDEVYCCTEKTLDPMVKGNFILPFSTPRFIRELKNWYGFRFPTWIDYSYDEIEDMEGRHVAYLKSVKSLLDMPIEQLHANYLADKDILEHNRAVIKNRPYDSLYDKVLRSMNNLGW